MPAPLLNNISPYEKLYARPIDYSDLKVFGCFAYVSTLERDRSKFDDRSKKGIFLGYENGMKGFRIYSLKSNEVIVSRNVIFHETVFPRSLEMSEDKHSDSSDIEVQQEREKDPELTKSMSYRKTARCHKQPEYLKDYHCSLIEKGTVVDLEQSKLYPLSKFLSYDRISAVIRIIYCP